MYVDESAIDTFISREYDWGFRGQKVIGEVSGKRYARERFVAALVNKKIIAPLCYQGTCDTNLFNFWLANFLLPTLAPGYTMSWTMLLFISQNKQKSLLKTLAVPYCSCPRILQI